MNKTKNGLMKSLIFFPGFVQVLCALAAFAAPENWQTPGRHSMDILEDYLVKYFDVACLQGKVIRFSSQSFGMVLVYPTGLKTSRGQKIYGVAKENPKRYTCQKFVHEGWFSEDNLVLMSLLVPDQPTFMDGNYPRYNPKKGFDIEGIEHMIGNKSRLHGMLARLHDAQLRTLLYKALQNMRLDLNLKGTESYPSVYNNQKQLIAALVIDDCYHAGAKVDAAAVLSYRKDASNNDYLCSTTILELEHALKDVRLVTEVPSDSWLRTGYLKN